MQSVTQAIASGDINAVLAAGKQAKQSTQLTVFGLRGKSDGEAIQKANAEYASQLAKTAMVLLCAASKDIGDNDSVKKQYLDGYGEAFTEQSRKFRKGEAKAVMDAFLKAPEKVNSMTEQGMGYHDIVAECRAIRGKRVNANVAVPKVTEKQQERIADSIKVATLPQAEAIAHDAIKQIVATAKGDWETAIVKQLDSLAAELSKSKQPIYQVFAEDILNTCAEILNTGVHAPEQEESEQEKSEAKAA